MPDWKTHLLLGGLAVIIAYEIWFNYTAHAFDGMTFLIGAVLALVASQFPDIDTGNSKIAEMFYTLLGAGALVSIGQFITRLDVNWLYLAALLIIALVAIVHLKHRGITHSWGIALLGAGGLALVNPFYGLAWGLGYASHLLPDGLSGKGKYL